MIARVESEPCLECRNSRHGRCRKCYDARRAPSESTKARTSESLLSFWNQRPFDQLGIRGRKKRVIDEQGGKCNTCSIGQVWNGKPLVFQLDHIDGNRSNCSRANLQALCPNCHTQTPTFASRSVDEETRARILQGSRNGAASLHEKRRLLCQ